MMGFEIVFVTNNSMLINETYDICILHNSGGFLVFHV